MDKLRTEIITLANYADTSKDGKLSISGVFDEIFVDKFPAQFARGFLVFTVSGGEPNSQHELKVQIVGPKGESIINKEFSVTTGRKGKGNFIIQLVGMPLPSKGDYKISVSLGKRIIGETMLYITPSNSNGKEENPSQLHPVN